MERICEGRGENNVIENVNFRIRHIFDIINLMCQNFFSGIFKHMEVIK